jgi:hypothetical protein
MLEALMVGDEEQLIINLMLDFEITLSLPLHWDMDSDETLHTFSCVICEPLKIMRFFHSPLFIIYYSWTCHFNIENYPRVNTLETPRWSLWLSF